MRLILEYEVRVLIVIIVLISSFWHLSPVAAQPVDQSRSAAQSALAGIKSWAYQLQNPDPIEIANSHYDLVVIDYSRNGVDAGRFTPDEVKRMQLKPDGTRRLVIAYLSIGEAEDYRFYWDPKWVEPAPQKRVMATEPGPPPAGPPAQPRSALDSIRVPRLVAPGWLGRENESWHGNYMVRFWYDGWQRLMFSNDDSYLARIQAAGFDGVFLDRVDAFYALEGDGRDAADRMVDLVVDLAKVARQRQPNFLIIAQNAEELLRKPRYLVAINGVAKEDLLFGSPVEGRPNAPQRIATSSDNLQLAQAAGLPVLIVEYLDQVDMQRVGEAVLRARGFVPYFGPRKLDRLMPPLPAVH